MICCNEESEQSFSEQWYTVSERMSRGNELVYHTIIPFPHMSTRLRGKHQAASAENAKRKNPYMLCASLDCFKVVFGETVEVNRGDDLRNTRRLD